MPIFEYKCQDCDNISSYIEKAGISGSHICKSCGSEKTKKILSTFSTPTPSMSTSSSNCGGDCSTGNCPMAN